MSAYLGRVSLRPYQVRAIDAVRQSYRTGHRAPCLVLPTGAGKTVIAAEVIRSAVALGRQVLFLVHRVELIGQSVTKLEQAGVHAIRIIQASTDLGDPLAPVAVASIPTLSGKTWRERLPDADLVIIDECFPAGTMIDDRPIDAIRVGELVRSFNHRTGDIEMCRVRRVFRSWPQVMVTVHLDDERRISCTAGHPFFVDGKYIEAINLRKGDAVYGANEVQEVPGAGVGPKHQVREGMHQEGQNLLLECMHEGVDVGSLLGGDGANEQDVGIGEDGKTESDEESGIAREDVSDPEGDWSLAEGSRREWDGTERSGGDAACRAWSGVDMEPRRAAWAEAGWLPNELQTRPSSRDDESRGGGGWIQPLRAVTESAGRQKAGITRVARVDRVEVHESTSDGEFGGVCPGGYVYNFEVENNNNYFVDGILVHNCHHTAARTWLELTQCYPNAKLLGLTATPERADGRAIGDVFDDLVVGSTVSELTELGHLVPLRTFAPREELDAAQVAISVAAAYRQLADDARAVVFCSTVEHARVVSAELCASGVPSDVVSGDMPAIVRADILAKFRAGELRCVVNVYVLTEGWDDPGCSVCILARKPAHAGTFLQMVGRVLRPYPGKPHATLIDLCGSVLEHGTPDADREYSLDGEAIRLARASLWQCAACGLVGKTRPTSCPNCGHSSKLDGAGRPLEPPAVVGAPMAEVSGQLAPRVMRAIKIKAKWPSKCRRCAGGIRVGEDILWAQGSKPTHARCG